MPADSVGQDTFLSQPEIVYLTGRKTKSRQILALRQMGIPFYVNMIGFPIVTKVAIAGEARREPPRSKWTASVLATGAH